ncbi:hypothetical protein QJS04_geneDACA014373 [Acorus gramineus]|uniref:Uncharacterized protein n=1 Tax=Acorus gramineus TaxID=55184 RepID=A0AAV9A105_ACOGR|nr:hypothetical protein QJS04_geneDACA014373 [Acorus gramineus]
MRKQLWACNWQVKLTSLVGILASYLQDDQQSSLHLGSQLQSMEVESKEDFGKKLSFDGIEASTRITKEKKPKHLGYQNSMSSNDCGGFIGSGKMAGGQSG